MALISKGYNRTIKQKVSFGFELGREILPEPNTVHPIFELRKCQNMAFAG